MEYYSSMRGKFLTATLILNFFVFLFGLLLFLLNPSFGSNKLPVWLNIFSFALSTIFSFLGLRYIWKMKRVGVYLFFLPLIWVAPLIFTGVDFHENTRVLYNTLIGLVLLIGPLVWAISRKWKDFE